MLIYQIRHHITSLLGDIIKNYIILLGDIIKNYIILLDDIIKLLKRTSNLTVNFVLLLHSLLEATLKFN